MYHIYDYRSLPVKTIGTLCSGLGPDTRLRMKSEGRSASRNTVLLALLVDELANLRWSLTSADDSKKPEQIAPNFLDMPEQHEEEGEKCSFDDAESFEAARARIINGA